MKEEDEVMKMIMATLPFFLYNIFLKNIKSK